MPRILSMIEHFKDKFQFIGSNQRGATLSNLNQNAADSHYLESHLFFNSECEQVQADITTTSLCISIEF